jgi:SagB-type dehydrogenase family enzyme
MPTAVKYRVSPHIVAYWEERNFVLHQFRRNIRVAAAVPVVAVIHACRSWRQLDEIAARVPELSPRVVKSVVRTLVATSFLVRSDRERPRRRATEATWGGWDPAAGFFHFATRDVQWAQGRDLDDAFRDLVRKKRREPPPAPLKRYRPAKITPLPAARQEGEFPSVLLARRTWRAYAPRPVSIEDLSTLLWLTAGVQMWGRSHAGGVRVPFTTSPSAGSKHPLELYVVARRISGLPAGLYHYAADDHELERLGGPVTASRLRRLLGGQSYFSSAAAVVFMTAMWERTRWTYSYARAYRSVLAEVGHVCQTFCLVATWLKLAPFCTMAIADREVDDLLRIDGVEEGVVYAAGVGVPPAGGWVQWPEHEPGRPSFPRRRAARSRRNVT